MDENDALRYWMTVKVYCGKCGNTLQGVYGTSGTGWTYYYYCSAQRRKQCTLKKVHKEKLEDAVTMILRAILHDSENLMSFAVDAAAYFEKFLHADFDNPRPATRCWSISSKRFI